MKTVAGAVTDSVPVSLSKAAKILSKFTSADNGASPEYIHYLMRASDAFNELVQLHKELSGSGSERRSKKHGSGIHVENSVGNYSEGIKAGAADGERLVLLKVNSVVKKEVEITIGNSVDSKRGKKEKKKIKKELSEEGRSKGGHGISNGVKEEEIEGKKNKKVKRGSEVEVEGRDGEIEKKSSNGGLGISNGVKEEVEGKKNKNVKRGSEVEVVGRDGEIEKKSSKKRKSGEIGVDGEGADSSNKVMQSKKKKKVKSEVDN